MKPVFLMSLALACALAAPAASSQPLPEPPVAVRVNQLPHHVRDRVQAKAAQGITALARYLELTRTVYRLRLMDVLADYDRSSFALLGEDPTEREVEDAIRAGKARPIR